MMTDWFGMNQNTEESLYDETTSHLCEIFTMCYSGYSCAPIQDVEAGHFVVQQRQRELRRDLPDQRDRDQHWDLFSDSSGDIQVNVQD